MSGAPGQYVSNVTRRDGLGRQSTTAAPSLLRRPEATAAALVAAFTLVRLVLMVGIGFGNDEAYTIAGARALHLSYFDHPPLHVWLAHASALAFGETRWVRLPFVLLFAGTGWLMFLLTRRLYGPKAGVWALLSLNLTPFFTLSAGGWVVPDGLLLFFLLAAVLALAPAVLGGPRQTSQPWRAWLVGGLCLGLAGLSKYNAILIALSLVAFVAASPRRRPWLIHPAPYLGAAVALIVVLPVIIWNADNGWVSFAFQTGRALPGSGLHPTWVLGMALGETALISPWIAIPLTIAAAGSLATVVRRPSPEAIDGSASSGDVQTADALLLSLAVPTVVAFTVSPLWSSRGLPHWPMPAWLFLYPILGSWIAADGHRHFDPRKWVIGSTTAFAVLLVAGWGAVRDGWISLAIPAATASRDPTLEALDWSRLRESAPVTDAHAAFAVAVRWMDAGKVAIALGPDVPTYVFSDDPRQFAFEPAVSRYLGRDAVIVMPAQLVPARLPLLRPYFAALDPIEHVWIGRDDRREVDLAVIHARTLLAPFPLPYPHHAGPESTP